MCAVFWADGVASNLIFMKGVGGNIDPKFDYVDYVWANGYGVSGLGDGAWVLLVYRRNNWPMFCFLVFVFVFVFVLISALT